MADVKITISAKVGAFAFEIESAEGDVIHHMSGSDFLKHLMDLASLIAQPSDEPPMPSFLMTRAAPEPRYVPPPAYGGPTSLSHVGPQQESDPSSMGSIDKFLSHRPREDDGVQRYTVDGQDVEQEPIFRPGSEHADKELKTFNDRQYDDSREGRAKRAAMERLNDADGWN